MSKLIEKDFLQAHILSDPFAFYVDAYAHHPVVKIQGQNMYAVFSYELIKEVIDRPDDFSSNFSEFVQGGQRENPQVKAIDSQGWPFVDTLLTADPPVHTRFRSLVNIAFSAPRVNKFSNQVRSLAIALLEDFGPSGQGDFSREFARRFPVDVITDMIGLSELPKERVRKWADAIADRFGTAMSVEREVECAEEVLAFQTAIMAQIQERRLDPRDDFVSALIAAEVAGQEPLSDVEILSILQQIIPAASDTTSIALTRGLLLLLKYPEIMQELRANPQRLAAFIEELLRIEAPGQSTFRISRRKTTLGGVEIEAGAQILVRVGAANRDPSVFSDPDRFDMDRKNVRMHMSFGRGHHSCLGMMLARKELAIAFEEILQRMQDIRIVEGTDLTFTPSLIAPGLPSLPIAFVWTASQGGIHGKH
jgi:cytochrome P450